MLAKRYQYDGVSSLVLNDLQRKVRNDFISKSENGTYRVSGTTCCICDSSATESLAEKDRYGLPYSVVICVQCGLVFSSPRMDQESYAAFYDCEYRPLYGGGQGAIQKLFDKGMHRGQLIATYLESNGIDLAGKRVFEVGCGSGGALAFLRQAFGCDVRGCDFGSEGVAYGVNEHNLNLSIGSIGSVEQEWRPDLVIYAHVFEHILDLGRECEQIKRFMRPGGLLYIEVPGIKNIHNAYQSDFLLYLQNAHTYHFSQQTLSNVMAMNGLAFVQGDQFVRSIFEVTKKTPSFVNDYNDVMAYLRWIERRRARVALQNTAFGKARDLLRMLGLKGFLRRWVSPNWVSS